MLDQMKTTSCCGNGLVINSGCDNMYNRVGQLVVYIGYQQFAISWQSPVLRLMVTSWNRSPNPDVQGLYCLIWL